MARGKIQSIKLEPYDDVVSIRDRLQFVEAERVLLVLPRHGSVLKRKLDLVLVQREAARRNLQIALLTHDPDIADNAAALNLSVFFNTRQARSHHWRRANTKIFEGRSDRHSPHPYELMGVASRLKDPPTKRQQRTRMLIQFIVGITMLTAVMGSIFALVPSATVTLTPAVDTISEPLFMTADPQMATLDVRNAVIPAQVVRILIQGGTVTVESSGRQEGADRPARGRVTFTNLTNSPQFIPAGTIVATSENPPVRFQTTSDLPLAGQENATAEVDILAAADSVGLAGNVASGAINRVEGVLDGTVGVSNFNATFGGGLVEEAVVTQADHERLLTLGRQAVQQAARNELLLQLPGEDKFLVPGSIRIVEERPEWTTYSAQVGDVADNVSLDMRATVEATVVDLFQARQLAFILLSQDLPPGRELNETLITYRHELIATDDQGRVQFQMFAEGVTPFAINAEKVADRIKGMSIREAERTLENELLLDPRHPPEIRTWPFNLGRLPFLPLRINVVVRTNIPQ